MRNSIVHIAIMALLVGSPVAAQVQPAADAMEARIWLDRGDDPVLQRGDRVRIYYRVNADSYVALFHIDTDGSVTLLYPRGPGEDDYVRGNRDYRLLFPASSYWYVDEYAGKGYFFMVASSRPLSFDDYGYSSYDHVWDLTQVGRSIYSDPYVAMDDHVAHLIPDWEEIPYALDFTTYDVGQTHDYPRFMCYQCHGYRSYTTWDPYAYGCSSVRVVVWDDPYYYPAYRYEGTRVVLARSRYGVPRYEFKERGAGETWAPLTRTRQPPPRGVQYAEPGVAAGSRQGAPSTRRAVPRDGPRPAPSTRTRTPTTWRPVVPSDDRGARTDSNAGRTAVPPGSVVAPPRTDRSTPAGQRPSTPRVTPPATGARPTLQRRPTGILTPSRPPTTGTGGRATGAPSGRGTVAPPTAGGTRGVIPRATTPGVRTVLPSPSSRSGSQGRPGATGRTNVPPTTSRPTTPPPRPALTPRPRTGGGSPPVARPKTGGGGRPAAKPPARTGGGGGRPVARPPARVGGGGGHPVARPKRAGGGGAA